jgi:hypothetical protein
MRKIMAAGLLALVVAVAAGPAADVRAARLQANITAVCDQLPALQEAISYTLKRWPATGENLDKLGRDNVVGLLYFYASTAADAVWCNTTRTGDGRVWNSHPDRVLGTMQWHFGNASEYLRAYQAAAQQP